MDRLRCGRMRARGRTSTLSWSQAYQLSTGGKAMYVGVSESRAPSERPWRMTIENGCLVLDRRSTVLGRGDDWRGTDFATPRQGTS